MLPFLRSGDPWPMWGRELICQVDFSGHVQTKNHPASFLLFQVPLCLAVLGENMMVRNWPVFNMHYITRLFIETCQTPDQTRKIACRELTYPCEKQNHRLESAIFGEYVIVPRRVATSTPKKWSNLLLQMEPIQVSPEKKKKTLTFHYTGCLIRILIMVYHNPYISG